MTTWVGPIEEPRRYAFEGDAEPVAAGGEGFVYRGRRVADDQPVAIKQLVTVPADEWSRQVARIRAVGGVSHPHLGRHLDAFVGPYPFTGEVPPADEFELLYTIMAWVDGEDLTDAATGADLPEAFGWVRDVAHAATALHRHPTPTGLGIVHRDIKPSNVRVNPEGAVLVDFGIARPMDGATMTRSAGAPGWMPPESFDDPKAVGVRSDTWQVGGLAAWVVLGAPPGALVSEDRRPRLERALRERGVRAARPLARHIDHALAARPADRPVDLQRWGDGLAALATAPAWSGRRRAAAIGAAVVMVALAAGGSLAVARAGDDEPAPGPTATAPPPPVGELSVDGGNDAPADFGQMVKVNVRYATPPPAGARVAVEPHSGGKALPVAAAFTLVPVDPAGQQLTFTVPTGPPDSRVVVDDLVVRVQHPDGRQVEQHLPVHLVFANPVRPPERCQAYDPTRLQVVDKAVTTGSRAGTPRWHVEAGPVLLADTTSRPDADQVMAVARVANARCQVAESSGNVPLTYWRRQGRLIGPPPPVPEFTNAVVVEYDPTELTISETRGTVQLEYRNGTLGFFDDRADAERAMDVARHYDRLSIIGANSRPANSQDEVALAFWG